MTGELNLINYNILFLSLNGEMSSTLASKLHRTGIYIKDFTSIKKVEEELASKQYRVCVIRCDSVDDSLLKLTQFIKQQKLPVELIVSSKTGFIEDAIRLIKSGATDFVVGDLFDPRLVESILKGLTNYGGYSTETDSENDKAYYESGVALIGQSSVICEIRSAVSLVAKSQTNVLITGESGTGKEVIAKLLHQYSNRVAKPFVALNCASIPKDIIENELFGHEKGAFTGALHKKLGAFEIADSGTLFFDEIGEMSLDTQAKLLRAIETQKFRRLGGKEEIKVDIRMIAATNRNITEAIKSKELREDLYYRLSVIEIFIPPLRERKEDLPLLVDYFLKMFAKKYNKSVQNFSDETSALLFAYDWPGNVRELKNIVERALVICPTEVISPHYLPKKLQKSVTTPESINIPIGCSTQEAERMIILQTLASTGNNKAKAAKILGVSRKTLHNKLTIIQHSEREK